MFSELSIDLAIAYAPSINAIVKTVCFAIMLQLIRPYHQAHSQMRLVMKAVVKEALTSFCCVSHLLRPEERQEVALLSQR